MPRPRHQLGQTEPANRQFTDREAFLAAFDRALQSLTRDRHSVLVYYGVGGIGKTSLVHELRRRLRETNPQVAQARLDFRDGENRLPASALVRLRSALRETNKIPFPTFDIAFAIHWKLANPHLPLARSELKYLDAGEIAGEVVGALAEVPVVGLVARIPRILGKLGRAAGDWWTRRGQAELGRIAALDDASAVAEWLPAFWGADLKAWLAGEHARRAVLFLDTFEALWEGQGEGERGTSPDEWVREWASHLEGALVVVAGRSMVRWTEEDPSWKDLLDQHLVGGLAPEDSERFLRTAGVAEQEVCAAIAKRSKGVPLYLDLAVDTYEQIRQRGDRSPRAEDFDANLGKLLSRFLHYLDKEERAALFKLSVPESFDRERFADLMRTFATGYPATADGLVALTRFSFVEEVEPGRYSLHALMRDALAAQDDAEERALVHRHLFEQVKHELQEVDPLGIADHNRRALRDGCTHGQAALEPEEFLNWYWQAESPFSRAAEWQYLLPLRELVLEYSERRLGPEHIHTLTAVNYLAFLLDSRGRYEDAEPLFRRALEARARVLGMEHPDTLTSVNNFASLLHSRGRLEDAEPLYRLALEASERVLGPEHPNTLGSVNNLALLLDNRGRYEDAEPLYRRALEARMRVLGQEHADTLTTVNNLAALLDNRGRYEEAELLHRLALEAREWVLGPDHPNTLVSVNNLAVLLGNCGRYEDAEPLYRRGLEGRERVLGPEHPHTLTSVSNLAFLLHSQGRLEDAEPLYRRALEAGDRVLGPEHPDTLNAVNNLAALLNNRERYEDAESLYRRALAARERVLGREHPKTLTTVNNLARLLDTRGRHDEAEPLYRRALEASERTLGPEHPSTLSVRGNLASLLRTMGQPEAG
jgi:tetratricopeptide (TPR) repeat protein